MIYILGAGAMARETLDIYRSLGRDEEVGGFIEQNCQRQGAEIHGKKVMDYSVLDTLPKGSLFIGAIGTPLRKKWIEEIAARGFGFDTAVHSSAVLGHNVEIAEGSIIGAGVVATCDITIGRHSIVNIGCTLSHDNKIGDFVTIAPGVNLAGRVTVGDRCWLSVGVRVINDITVGEGSFIGAGAIVSKDIPDNVFALGTPARQFRKLKESDWKDLV